MQTALHRASSSLARLRALGPAAVRSALVLTLGWSPFAAHVASAACTDTVLVRSAKTYSKTGSSPVLYVDTCTVMPEAGRRFLLEVLRPGGANALTSAQVAYGGVEYFGTDDVDATGTLLSRVITPKGADSTLRVTLVGGAGTSSLVVRVTQVPEPLYNVYSTTVSGASTAKSYTKYFSFADTVPASPHVMVLQNGSASLSDAARSEGTEVWVNGQQALLTGEVTYGRAYLTRDVTLYADNTVQINFASGQSGNSVTLRFYGTDDTPPELTVSAPTGSPTDTLVTKALKVLGTAYVEELQTPVRLFVSGAEKTLTNGFWSDSLTLPAQDGKTTFSFVARNGACLADSTKRVVVRDTQAPALSVLDPWPNYSTVASGTEQVTFRIPVADTTRTLLYVDGDSVGVLPMGYGVDTLLVPVPLDVGPNGIHLRAIDALGQSSELKWFVNRLPAGGSGTDSSTFLNSVPPLTYTEDTGFRSRVSFLYEGSSPAQTGLSVAALEPGREAVIRGRVLSRDFGPLGGVTVQVLDHPEFGESTTRNDGAFDMVVNGGGTLVLRFRRAGYLETQRQVKVPTQDYVTVDDVSLIGRSGRWRHIETSVPRVVEGRFENDANGDRRMWLSFPAGDTAIVTPAVGEPLLLTQYRVRIKEFTVGGDGLEAMPALLPPSSAYTYCLELGLVEADSIADVIAAQYPNATVPEIRFTQPIVTYVRDFLGLPVGAGLPSGYYDARLGRWVAEENARVIQVRGILDSLVVLDTDGEGIDDTPADYDTAGIDVAERVRLAALFRPGDVVWRARVQHFSLHDLTPTVLATDLNANSASDVGSAGKAGVPPPTTLDVDDPTNSCGCVVENENRVLGETLPLRGTPFALHYRSNRQPGDRAMRWLRVPLLGDSVPPQLRRVHLRVEVAGRKFEYTFGGLGEQPLAAGMEYIFRGWSGTDVYGRRVPGSVTATVRVGWEFGQRYSLASAGGRGGLGDPTQNRGGSLSTTGDRDVGNIAWTAHRVSLGAPSMAGAGLGGWTITPHHYFDPNGTGTLYLGDGGVRHNALLPIIKRYAGNGTSSGANPTVADTAAATAIALSPYDIAVGPDGSVYFTDDGSSIVGRIWPNGGFKRLTAQSNDYSSDDEGSPASTVRLPAPGGIVVGTDGSIYVTSRSLHRVFKIAPDGTISCVAGNGVYGAPAVDDVPATQSGLSEPTALALGPDGSLFIGDHGHRRIRRVGTDGIIRTYAGTGEAASAQTLPDEGTATDIKLGDVDDMVVDSQGNLYLTEGSIDRVRWVSPDGQIHSADWPGHQPKSIAAGSDGTIYVGQTSTYAGVARLDSDGEVSTVAGTINNAPYTGNSTDLTLQEGILARAAVFPGGFTGMGGVAQDAAGRIFVGQKAAGNNVNGIRVIVPQTPLRIGEEIVYPAEGGREAYVFSSGGRHKRTIDALSGVDLMRFEYDAGGRLVRMIDGNDDTTRIERDGSGQPEAVVAPYAQRTELDVDPNGFLAAVRNPLNGEEHTMSYVDEGLLETVLDPAQHEQRFTYRLGSTDEDDGRLWKDRDAAYHEQTFTQAEVGRTRTVTKRSAMTTRVTTYEVTRMLDGLRRRLIRMPDGTESSAETDIAPSAPFGERVIEASPDGDTTVTRRDRDPRFSLLAPLDGTSVTRLPSGSMRTVTRGRSVAPGVTVDTLIENGRTWISTYDSTLRRLTTVSPANRQVVGWFDTQGRVTASKSSGLATQRWTYNGRGKLTRLEQGPRHWVYSYDSWGRLSTVENASGHVVEYRYDAADRDTGHILPDGRSVGYRYYADGRLMNLHPPGRPLHEFGYTPVGLNDRYTPPEVDGVPDPASDYAFNPDRQLTDINRPDGITVHFDYGSTDGRLQSITQPRGVSQFTYWDTPQPGASKPSGQLKTASSPDSVICAYEYDGPLLRKETWSGAVAGVVERIYDQSFRDSLERVTAGGTSSEVRYHYDDPDGLLTKVSASSGGNWEYLLQRATATGLVDSTTVGTGAGQVTSSAGYDSLGQLTELNYSRAGAPLFHQSIERNALGQVTRIDESWYGGPPATRAYGYNLAGWLDSVVVAGVVRRYAYDDNGNRTMEYLPESGGIKPLLVGGTYDEQDRIQTYGSVVFPAPSGFAWVNGPDTITYNHTANGEWTKRTVNATASVTEYDYDAMGSLTQVRMPGGGDTLSYTIDGRNRRVGLKRNGMSEQQWLYGDQIPPVAELDGAGALLHRYVYASLEHSPDLLVRGDTAYRVLTDHLGSVRALVRASDGAIVQRIDYDSWGAMTADTGGTFQALGFGGGLTDRTTGLVRFGARDLAPTVGRWTSKDPILFAGASVNLYSYVDADPINHLDEEGTRRWFTLPGRLWIDPECKDEYLKGLFYVPEDGGAPVPLGDGMSRRGADIDGIFGPGFAGKIPDFGWAFVYCSCDGRIERIEFSKVPGLGKMPVWRKGEKRPRDYPQGWPEPR